MTYNVLLRYAGESQSAIVHLEVNGKLASKSIVLAPSGNWNTWKTISIPNVMIPSGLVKVKVVFEKGGINFNYMQFRNPKSTENTTFELLNAQTDKLTNSLYLKFNKAIDAISGTPFQVTIDGQAATILSNTVSLTDNQEITLKIHDNIFIHSVLKISCNGSAITSGTQTLATFTNVEVQNLTYQHQVIPGKIEAESFVINNGFSTEICTDAGGGEDLSYTAKDMSADYLVMVLNNGEYKLDFRISVSSASAQIALLKDQDGSMVPLKTVSFSQTGGWQNWQTQSTTVPLTAGKNIIRLLSRTDGYNLNWIEFSQTTAAVSPKINDISLYPNPAHDTFYLNFSNARNHKIELIDLQGRVLSQSKNQEQLAKIDIKGMKPGMYFVKIVDQNNIQTMKIQII